MKQLKGLLLILLCVAGASGASVPVQQTVTLYAPLKYNHDFSRASFSFLSGARGTQKGWDVLYGNTYIGDDHDWLSASTARDNRSLIRDLGALNWFDAYKIPVIVPLPKLEEGKERNITVDSSGGTGRAWAEKNGIFVKAIVGHMYVMRVKDSVSDFYVVFRVESIERGDNCTLSWQLVPSPE